MFTITLFLLKRALIVKEAISCYIVSSLIKYNIKSQNSVVYLTIEAAAHPRASTKQIPHPYINGITRI